ncbi:hypothetical protein DOTSEDRAFT_124512 [Dothistroma septosporum NZE10]|uniref:Uncharacterized protein n=1 Tax=Dothistroma septosporum (strain NZE10 / CBS 128990) TaxID=675120 RepID=N1PWN6_DOTSN|nr:hypothetical protein DOTSEDRAFT_124512 [Dothistroma septosporum NZE10]
MAIREKAKNFFKKSSRSENGSQLSKSSTQASDRDRWPSNVYKPGEPMPRPKYRAPPKKEHKEKLESFSFAEAWRRRSFQSQYSPMGTRAPSRRNSSKHPSRRNSWLSIGRKSFSGKSTEGGRSNSITSGETEKNGVRQREHLGAARPPALQNQPEAEGDDDVGNVGMSRVQSKDHGMASRPRTSEGQPNGSASGNTNGLPNLIQTLSTAHDHHPFTEKDLALALQRSHLAVPTQG